ncbi:Arylsulfatase [compost metagenome]
MFSGKASPHADTPLAGELFGNAYYREGSLKLLGLRPQVGFNAPPQPLKWQLFDIASDRGETRDIAPEQPVTVQRLKDAWQNYSKRVGVVFPPTGQDSKLATGE